MSSFMHECIHYKLKEYSNAALLQSAGVYIKSTYMHVYTCM